MQSCRLLFIHYREIKIIIQAQMTYVEVFNLLCNKKTITLNSSHTPRPCPNIQHFWGLGKY